ncbi:MAG: Histidine kinase, partial [Campylobacterota bacterium]|nr:Histidine kinase [Campylobacterota bacterium]
MEETGSEIQLSPKSLLKQQLKKNNPDFRYYKSLFNMTSDLIAITDGDSVIDANKSFMDFFEASNIDILDHNFALSSVFQKIDKYGYVYDGYKDQRWFEHINQNSKDYYRVAILGSKKLYDFNITIKKFEFSEDVFIVILTDITNIMGYKNTLEYHLRSISKNKEETEFLFNQYNSAIDISNLVIKMDIEGNITYVNDAFCKALKYESQELIYKNIKILCNPDETCDCYSLIVNAVKNSK